MKRGFTLIEALMASALLMVLLVQLGQIQQGARAALQRVRRAVGEGQPGTPGSGAPEAQLTAARKQLETDCAQFLIPGLLRKGEPALDLTNVGGSTASAELTFYSACYRPAGCQEVRRVTWRLGAGGLERVSAPAVERPWLAPERTELMVAGVAELTLAFFDGKEFVESWAGRKGLPQGLRMHFLDPSKKAQNWEPRFHGALE